MGERAGERLERTRASRGTYAVEREYPHDSTAFTQGLVFAEGQLYESTGLLGHSTLRLVDPESGVVLRQHRLPADHFGEDITCWGSTIVQLTWRSGVGFVYDRSTLTLQRTFAYAGEGWGLTHDGDSLIMSDGTATLRRLDAETFEERGRVRVHDDGVPVTHLNALQFVDGEVWANVWRSEAIARICPRTGRVLAWIDLCGLYTPPGPLARQAVLNGIAYDDVGRRLWVTGKFWPRVYEIRILPAVT